MVQYGIFFAYWARNWNASPEELKDRVRRASESGFDLLEIHCDALLPWDSEDRAVLRRHADEHDLDLSFVTTLTSDADVYAPDPDTRQRGVDQLTSAIEIVDEMDGRYLGGLTYGAWNPTFEGGIEEKADRKEQSIDTWKEVANIAEAHDVLCTVEVVNRFEQYMLNTAAEARPFVEVVDSPNLQIMLDTFHMNIEEDDFADAIKTAGDHLGHFHVGENNRKLPREGGNMPWPEIGEALDSIDYDGPVVMEPFVLPGGDIAQDVALWRDLSGDENLDDNAAKSLQYLKNTFER